METFFNWLSSPGPYEEISVILCLLILIVGIPFWLRYLKISKISKNGVEFDVKSSSEKKSKYTALIDNNHSSTASQDHKLFTLILRDFSHKVKNEIKEYCRVNGLNLKTDEEYKEYIEEKKSVYFSELREMFQNEYIAYDLVTLEDVEDILETLRDYTFHRIENMYKKVRDISILEHKNLDEKKKVERQLFIENLKSLIERWKEKEKNLELSLDNILNIHYTEIEEIIKQERITILDKQIHIIDECNKSITRRYIEEFEKTYRQKRNELLGGTNNDTC